MDNIKEPFGKRLSQALTIRGMRAVDLSERTGISKSLISQYINLTKEARQDNLHRIALALNVSEAWLMGFNVPMDRELVMPGEPIKDEQVKVALFGGDGEVTDEQWEEVLSFVEYVKQKHKKEK